MSKHGFGRAVCATISKFAATVAPPLVERRLLNNPAVIASTLLAASAI
jgi:hypothetical protein